MCVAAPCRREAAQAAPALVLFRPYQWPASHRVVTVRFLDGGQAQKAAVRVLVRQWWNRASGLQFEFVDGPPADVRVSFRGVGNWSHPGSYVLGLPEPTPTMMLAGVTETIRLVDVRRLVLHEFGHAAGFMHEQLSPKAAIPWDLPAVYRYYGERGWDKAMVDAQVLVRMGEEVAEAGAYDSDSIMQYIIPPELVLDRVARGGKSELSSGDVAMARHWYGDPPAVPEPPPVVPPPAPPKWSWFIPYVETEEE